MQVNVNMTSVAGSVWRAVKPHIPLIKFRKGGLSELVHGAPQLADTNAASGKPPAVSPSSQAAAARPVLEEWQTPLRYRRQPITEEEIEYINRGGPA